MMLFHRYEIVEGIKNETTGEVTSPPQLVVRRGQPFKVKLILNRDYNGETDRIKVVSEIGKLWFQFLLTGKIVPRYDTKY